MRGRLAAVLAVLALGSVGCDPKVYELHAGGDPADSINLLFLGDGFSTSELQSYRAASEQLTQGLLDAEPFCNVRDRINVYRIDVVDDGGVDWGTCTTLCSDPGPLDVDATFVESSSPASISGSSSTVELDLGVERCWSPPLTAGPCNLLWPNVGGKFRAHQLARRAPNITAIVILANTEATAGGGNWAVFPGSQAMAVAGVPLATLSDGTVEVSTTALGLFAHELGHALGLVDEYTGSVSFSATPPTDRNVWQPPSEPPVADPIPWRDVLASGCDPSSMTACCGNNSGPGVCDVCAPFVADATLADCVFVPARCASWSTVCSGGGCSIPAECTGDVTDGIDLCVPSECGNQPGAWEGALYSWTGFYRSMDDCSMKTLTEPFCAACRSHLWRTHFCSDAGCADPSPVLGTCPP